MRQDWEALTRRIFLICDQLGLSFSDNTQQLYREMHRKLQDVAGSDYLDKATRAGAHAQLLRDLIATRMRLGPS